MQKGFHVILAKNGKICSLLVTDEFVSGNTIPLW